MKLTVKTLKGGKFNIECEPSKTVSEVKELIVSLMSHLGVFRFVVILGLDDKRPLWSEP